MSKEENKLVPRRRFKEFKNAGAWEQRKLGELVTIERGGSPRPINKYITNDPDGLNWIKIGDAPDQGRYITHTKERIKPSGLSKTRQVFPGDLILSNSMTFGKPYIMKINGCIHDGWLLLRNDQDIFDLKFLCQMLGTEQMFNQYKSLAAGSTVNNLNKELVSNALVDVPSKEEQVKIGEYLENLDHLITLHQRKLDKLKKTKSAYLNEMFPAEGEREPKRRFAGFTGAWEQRKVSELGEIITGSTPSTSHSEYYSEDGIPWVTPTDIHDNTISDTTRKLSLEGQKVGRVVPADTILVTCIASIGKNTMLTTKGSFNQQINGLVPDKVNYYPYFLLTESVVWSKKMKSEAAAGTMQIVNRTDFSSIKTMVPSLPEQRRIGDYFKSLDDLITLHQRKLDKLKKLKSAYLNEMFV